MTIRSDYIPGQPQATRLHQDHRLTTESRMNLDPALRAALDVAGSVPEYSSSTVVVFALGLAAWFVVRLADFDERDWLGACEVIGPDTLIDSGAWDVDDDFAALVAIEKAVIANSAYETTVSSLHVVAS